MLPADSVPFIVPFNCTTLAVITDSAKQLVPIIEVAFKKEVWRSMPTEMSAQIYQKYLNGEDVVYTWDWGASRPGSFATAGEQISINRYMIDFQTMEQVNIGNGRRRSVRLVCLHGGKAGTEWNGQIDGQYAKPKTINKKNTKKTQKQQKKLC